MKLYEEYLLEQTNYQNYEISDWNSNFQLAPKKKKTKLPKDKMNFWEKFKKERILSPKMWLEQYYGQDDVRLDRFIKQKKRGRKKKIFKPTKLGLDYTSGSGDTPEADRLVKLKK